MFSLERINAKLAKGKKKKVEQPSSTKKKKAGSFLSLETTSPLFKEGIVQKETNSASREKTATDRYYNYSKLIEDDVENPEDDWGVSHKIKSKYIKSQFLKLNKTSDEVIEEAEGNLAGNTHKEKMSLNSTVNCNEELNEDFEEKKTLSEPSHKAVSIKKNAPRKRHSDVYLHKANLKKKKSKNELPFNEIKNKDLETEISNIKISRDYCSDTDSEVPKLYVDSLTLSEDALLVALFPNTEIYFCGNVWVKLLAGSISVFGYKFKEGDLYPVFSHQSHSLLSMKVSEGKNVKQFSPQHLKECDIPSEWIQRLDVDETCQLTVIKLCRFENSATRLIQESKVLNQLHIPKAADCLFEEILGIKIVNPMVNMKNPLYYEAPEWNECTESLLPDITKDPRIIIAGGKGVGKSTFLKYVINRLLSDNAIDAVACIDIDPGQPEFSLPSVLSLTKVVDPALGPAFTHTDGMNLCDQTQLLIGDINVTNVLMEYLSVVQKFEELYTKKYSSIPLVINTMGFTSGTGSDIMVAVLRIFNPTHVMVIKSPKSEYNYEYSLAPKFINNVGNRGIFHKKLFSRTLDYKLINMKTVASYHVKANNLALRDLRILANLSKLWKDEELQLNGLNCKKVIKIPWNFVAIHVINSVLPVEYTLEAINANLVALCKIDDVYFEESRAELPRQIKSGCHWYNSCKCLGWGIVRGIDPLSRDLHILTPLEDEEVMFNVNAMILTKICLPAYLSKLFSGGKGGPYLQKFKGNERRQRKRK